ncbi:hypothetical protein LguiA_032560 [Lonicera macranthoides]
MTLESLKNNSASILGLQDLNIDELLGMIREWMTVILPLDGNSTGVAAIPPSRTVILPLDSLSTKLRMQ